MPPSLVDNPKLRAAALLREEFVDGEFYGGRTSFTVKGK